MKKLKFSLLHLLMFVMFTACGQKKSSAPDPTPTPPAPAPVLGDKVDVWLTKGDQTQLLQKQTQLQFSSSFNNALPVVSVDLNTAYQTVDGFGYTLTGGSAELINKMGVNEKAALLQELFGNGENAISVSYLRVSIGASDLSSKVFSYNDLPAGQTDPTLAQFSIAEDEKDLIPVLKQILAINPNIKILGSPWSAPIWMKTNGSSIGGNLKPEYYNAYAQYFVKYINAMKAHGINIDAVTIQNEPQHGGNNPSMVMSATEQGDFIKNSLGPAFKNANLTTKIIIWDHNADNPQYPITILNDPEAKKYIDGSAFHLYAGDIGALSTVYSAHPDKNLYFTEQWTSSTGDFGGDLKWHMKNVIIGSMRNRSKVALEWNLANDPVFGPHTPGGCTQCKGAVTILGNSVTRNVAYYIVAHASKFVAPGSVRYTSSVTGNNSIQHVFFKTPAGKRVLILSNDGNSEATFNIQFDNKAVPATLSAGAAATYVW